ncbi:hypothetical protein [Pontibacillus halophilus]|uniref:hypothetical protein n=1 Tax=Pontibacillus halophilus TaxID=516704 RepID=UPI0004155451|nr:hypothetical protein [Pontibacillus halophilus]
MSNNTEVRDFYLFGVGYTVIDNEMLEVRSLGTETHQVTNADEIPPSLSKIIKRDGQEWNLDELNDPEIIDCLDKGIVYREWILEKEEFDKYLECDSLLKVNIKELKTKKIRQFS